MRYSLFISLALLLMTACSKDTIEMPDPDIDFIHTAEVTFEGIAEDQAATINFTSPKPWTAEIHQTGAWLKADLLQGNAGQAAITLSPRSDNFGVTARQATLEIYVDGYQAYTITVQQKSASTSDIVIDGHINDGVMTLQSDESGNIFSDTIYVTSSKQWSLSVDPSAAGILSFQTNTLPPSEQGGQSVIVSADYSKFTGTSLDSKFYIKTTVPDGSPSGITAVPVRVKAQSSVEIYEKSHPTLGETQRTSYQLVDTIQHAIYQTTFYVDSNVRWTITDKPSWLETSADWTGTSATSNIKTDGTIAKNRHPVTLRVKASEMSVEGKTCALNILNTRGQILKTVNLVFAGISSSFVSTTLAFPGSDINGNPWAFEAHRSTVEESGAANRRRISMEFYVTTSTDYTSLNDAPYHMILVQANNGIPAKKEHHWATLKMGSKSEQTQNAAGMYEKQLIIEANERGDADDQNGLTTPMQSRSAFVFIVPRSVTFYDLWNNNGTIKDDYASDFVLMTQKNDPLADYKFALVGVKDGGSIGDINPKGESRTFDVVAGSYDKCNYNIELQKEDGTWVNTDACTMTYKLDNNDQPVSITLNFKENKPVTNPFTHQTTGSDRHFRITFSAFIDDNIGSKVIYTFYADQKLQ